MDLRTVVRQVDQDVVDERRDDRLGRRELLAVQHEARRTVPQEHRVLDGDVGPVQGTPVIRLGLDEEGPVQTLADRLRRVEVRVVHTYMPSGSTTSNSYTKNPPDEIGSYVMNGTPSMSLGTVRSWKCMIVGCVISFCTTIRTWSPWRTRISGPGLGSVVRHRVHEHAGRGLPPHLGRREVEDLHAVLVPRLERLVPEPLGLRRESCDARLVSIEHLFGAHGAAGRAHRTRRSAALPHPVAPSASPPCRLPCGLRSCRRSRRFRPATSRPRALRFPLAGSLPSAAPLAGIDREGMRRRPIVRHLERQWFTRRRVNHGWADRELRERDLEGSLRGCGTLFRGILAGRGATACQEHHDQGCGKRRVPS